MIAVKKTFQNKSFMNRELEIMVELRHPNIVKLREYYYTKENHVLKFLITRIKNST